MPEPAWIPVFLEVLSATGRVDWAARVAAIQPRSVRNRKSRDASFRTRYDAALSQAPGQERKRADSGQWHETFLAALRTSGIVSQACRRAQISREIAYRHRREDPVFARAWDDARADAADTLEGVARARALQGSERLLEFLLRGLKPDIYGDRVRMDHRLERKAGDVYEAALEHGLTPAEAELAVERWRQMVAKAAGADAEVE